MSIDFEPDEQETALADALTALCRQHCTDEVARAGGDAFPSALWRELAGFGLFTLATPDGFGGVVEVAAAGAVLGTAFAPGPLAQTFLAAQVLPNPWRSEVVSCAAVVSIVAPPHLPGADAPTLLLECDGTQCWRVEAHDLGDGIETLSGEVWRTATFARVGPAMPATRGLAVADIFLAAYFAAAARKLAREASAYVAARRQFGKALAQFQAVSHPLASVEIRARAGATLARMAAVDVENEAPHWSASAAVALDSARAAALLAISTCHQLYGAMGMTVDGPVYYASRRLRQLANLGFGARHAREAALEGAFGGFNR